MFHNSLESAKRVPPLESIESKKHIDTLNCNFADYSFIHLFRLLTQTVCISELDFINQTFRVSTIITVHPLSTRVTHIVLNLGKGFLDIFLNIFFFVFKMDLVIISWGSRYHEIFYPTFDIADFFIKKADY